MNTIALEFAAFTSIASAQWNNLWPGDAPAAKPQPAGSETNKDDIDQQSCRPDLAILIYPVISMSPPLTHSGSRKHLLGENPSAEAVDKLSTAKAVTKDTPPIFLLTTADDFVDCRNSLEFATACKVHKVPVSLHLFESGGHGYGLHGKGDLATWPLLLEQWLARK